MRHFTPTLGIADTSKNIQAFVKANTQAFWDIMTPLLPYIAGLLLFDAVISTLFFSESKQGFALGSIIANYFYMALVISWHRVVIHGPDQYVRVNPFKPRKSELIFMGMGLLIGGGMVLVIALLAVVSFLIGPVVAVIVILLGVLFMIYGTFRLCFYFPARATDSPITLAQSYTLTKGYFWKLTLSSLRASVKNILLVMAYMMLVFMPLILAAGFLIGNDGLASTVHLLTYVLMLPLAVYFQPLLTIIGVTALSNYYLYAINHRAKAPGTA